MTRSSDMGQMVESKYLFNRISLLDKGNGDIGIHSKTLVYIEK